jgi:hypothetical protein
MSELPKKLQLYGFVTLGVSGWLWLKSPPANAAHLAFRIGVTVLGLALEIIGLVLARRPD